MNQLKLSEDESMHQIKNFFHNNSIIYSKIIDEKPVDERSDSLQQLCIKTNDDCFWQTFTIAYTHNWWNFNSIKLCTWYWFEYVIRKEAHIYNNLYCCLDVNVSSEIIDSDNSLCLTLTQQFMYVKAWTSKKMFQVMADCFDVELIMFQTMKKDDLMHSIRVWRAYNWRQILLCINLIIDHYDALIYNVKGVSKEHYRYWHHCIDRDDNTNDLCF